MDTKIENSPTIESQPVEKKPPRKTALFVAAGLALVLLMGGAAYTAGRLLNHHAAGSGKPMAIGGPGSGAMLSGAGPGGKTTYKLDFEPAEELPKTEADARGIFTKKEDNSIFIGTGKVSIMAAVGKGGGSGGDDAHIDTNYDGPVVEIVVTGDTTLYKDVTEMSPGKVESGAPIRQKVAPGSVEEIDQNSMISVWGKKVGDRIIADVLLYSLPQIFYAPK